MAIFSRKYAPQTLDDVLLSDENKKFFNKDFNLSKSPNLLFIGRAGVGKTTLAKLLAEDYDSLYINASDSNGIDVIRNTVTSFVKTSSLFGEIKVVILDEADGLSSVSTGNGSSAQQALRGLVEDNLDICRFILTANYEHKVCEPLQSRCQTFHFDLTKKHCAIRIAHIAACEGIKITKESLGGLINTYYPDLRKCINEFQKGIDKDNVFVFNSSHDSEIAQKIKKGLDKKENIFDIRASLIKDENSFKSDYHSIMKDLFNIYCKEKNSKAVMACCYHMEKHSQVMDKEVNFASLLLNLANE